MDNCFCGKPPLSRLGVCFPETIGVAPLAGVIALGVNPPTQSLMCDALVGVDGLAGVLLSLGVRLILSPPAFGVDAPLGVAGFPGVLLLFGVLLEKPSCCRSPKVVFSLTGRGTSVKSSILV